MGECSNCQHLSQALAAEQEPLITGGRGVKFVSECRLRRSSLQGSTAVSHDKRANMKIILGPTSSPLVRNKHAAPSQAQHRSHNSYLALGYEIRVRCSVTSQRKFGILMVHPPTRESQVPLPSLGFQKKMRCGLTVYI